MKIFLDDERTPSDCALYMHRRIGKDNTIYLERWETVRTYKQFVEFITEMIDRQIEITHISFDHDLADCFQLKEQADFDAWFDVNGNREYTGLDCAKWLKNFYKERDLTLPIMYVHSMNPVGTQRIIDLFK